MLSIEHFYWVLAAFLAYAGWRNLQQRRYAHAAFWTVIAALFAGGDVVLRASKTGDALPAQFAGGAVLVLALLAMRMRREPLDEAPESERLASALRLGHRLFVPALLIPALTITVVLAGPHLSLGGTPAVRAHRHDAGRPGLGLRDLGHRGDRGDAPTPATGRR